MRAYIIYALIAAFIVSLRGIYNKYLLVNRIRDSFTLFTYIMLIGGMFAPLLFLLTSYSISRTSFIAVIFSAVFECLGYLLYYRALSHGDVSTVEPLAYAQLIFVVLLAAVFLNERISGFQATVIIVIILGSILLCYSESGLYKIFLENKKLLIEVFCADFLWASGNILNKLLLKEIATLTLIAWRSIIISVFMLFLVIFMKRKVARFQNMRNIGYLLVSVLLFYLMLFFLFTAFEKGSITISFALFNSAAVFSFLFSLIISRLHPEFIDEQHSYKVYLIRMTGLCMLIFGLSYLVIVK